jgi:hypothetical protein
MEFLQSNKMIKVITCHKCKEIGHKSNDCYQNKEYQPDHPIFCFDCQRRHPYDSCPNNKYKNNI